MFKKILGILLLVFISFLFSKLLTQTAPLISISLVVGLAVAILAFLRPDLALMVLVFSMLLSPEIIIGHLPGRDIVIRLDDLLLVLIFISWLVRTALYKELGFIMVTPLNKPIAVYISICFIASLIGMFSGEINWLKSFFYFFRYLEYFVLFFMVTNIVQSEKQIKIYLLAGLITCLIVTVYVYTQFGTFERVTAPFEGRVGDTEPNTLGGYYLIIIALILGFFAYSPSKGMQFFAIGLFLFLIPPFIRTLSRASYFGFIPMLVTLIIFTRRKKIFLIAGTVVGIILFPLIFKTLYQDMVDRVLYTFRGSSGNIKATFFKKNVEQSAGERLESWINLVEKKLPSHPGRTFLGWGVTGAGFIDGQYFLILGETGLLGLLAFFWLLFSILKNSYQIYTKTQKFWLKGFSLGMISATAGLAAHAIPSNTFIIIRIMEPFWFLLGLIMAAKKIRA